MTTIYLTSHIEVANRLPGRACFDDMKHPISTDQWTVVEEAQNVPRTTPVLRPFWLQIARPVPGIVLHANLRPPPPMMYDWLCEGGQNHYQTLHQIRR